MVSGQGPWLRGQRWSSSSTGDAEWLVEGRGLLNPKGCRGGWEGGGRAVASGPCGLWRFWWGPQRAKERKQRNNVPVEHRRKIFSPNFSGREPICHCCEPVEWVLLPSGGSRDHCFPPGYGKPDCTSTNQSEASLPETVIGSDVTGWDFPSAFKAASSSRLQPATKIHRAAVYVAGHAALARPLLRPTSEARSWVLEPTVGPGLMPISVFWNLLHKPWRYEGYSDGVPTRGTLICFVKQANRHCPCDLSAS